MPQTAATLYVCDDCVAIATSSAAAEQDLLSTYDVVPEEPDATSSDPEDIPFFDVRSKRHRTESPPQAIQSQSQLRSKPTPIRRSHALSPSQARELPQSRSPLRAAHAEADEASEEAEAAKTEAAVAKAEAEVLAAAAAVAAEAVQPHAAPDAQKPPLAESSSPVVNQARLAQLMIALRWPEQPVPALCGNSSIGTPDPARRAKSKKWLRIRLGPPRAHHPVHHKSIILP